MFSYILVSSYSMLKVGKLPIIAIAILAILFKNYFKGAKIWWLFAQLYRVTKIPLIVLCWKS